LKIKLIKEPIRDALGICFKKGAYDPELIKQLNDGEEVEVEMIPKKAKEYVKEVKPKKSKKKDNE
jgi:hypothetical protein